MLQDFEQQSDGRTPKAFSLIGLGVSHLRCSTLLVTVVARPSCEYTARSVLSEHWSRLGCKYICCCELPATLLFAFVVIIAKPSSSAFFNHSPCKTFLSTSLQSLYQATRSDHTRYSAEVEFWLSGKIRGWYIKLPKTIALLNPLATLARSKENGFCDFRDIPIMRRRHVGGVSTHVSEGECWRKVLSTLAS